MKWESFEEKKKGVLINAAYCSLCRVELWDLQLVIIQVWQTGGRHGLEGTDADISHTFKIMS